MAEAIKLPQGYHQFIMARPKSDDWAKYDGSAFMRGRYEWRPVKVEGHGDGQRVWVIGDQHGYLPEEFDFGKEIAPPHPLT